MLRRIAFSLFAAFIATAAQAQTYPDRPIRLIAPFPAGGLADVLARAIGDEMSKSLGQPVIVENRAGAGGNTGADAVAKAAPDGYTLLMSSAGILTANPYLYAKMPFDAETAFIPVSNVARDEHDPGRASQGGGAETLEEFVALAKAQPEQAQFRLARHRHHRASRARDVHACRAIQITHVPYRGAAPAVTDLIAGQIDGVVDNPPTVISHIQGGKLRPLAFAAKQRLALSAGRADRGRGRPRQLRGDVLVRHRRAGRHAGRRRRAAAQGDRRGVRTPAMQERFAKSGARLVGDTPEQFAAQIRAERGKLGRDHQGGEHQGGVIRRSTRSLLVMPGLVPGIHRLWSTKQGVDGRDKPGHDGEIAPNPPPAPWR